MWRVRVNSVGGGGTDREEAPTQGKPRTDLVIWAAVPAAEVWGLESFDKNLRAGPELHTVEVPNDGFLGRTLDGTG